MKIDKRGFLKLSGLALAGLSVKPAAAAAARPAPAKAVDASRLALVVDMRKCLNFKNPDQKITCTACIDACHFSHNVPLIKDQKHEIKWLWQAPYENVFAIPHEEFAHLRHDLVGMPLVTLCNHCDEPPCVRVCPTKATFKRESDGIVMMDYHRCIGCRYCMAGCPYGSRSFNYVEPRKHLDPEKIESSFPARTKGVVEKCSFCAERINPRNPQQGLPPYCVEACREATLQANPGAKEFALIFGDLNNPRDPVAVKVRTNLTLRRKPELGTLPMVYYIV